jgi:hypothetical protein
MSDRTVSLHRVLRTTPDKLYRAFLDPEAMAKWIPPHGFICTVHSFDARVGGTFRMSFRNFGNGHSHSFGGLDYSLEPKYIEIAPRFAIRNYVTLGATSVGRLWGPGPDGRRRPDGTIYCLSDTRLKDITDGLSSTVVVCETREQNAAVWIDGTGAAAVARRFAIDEVPSYAGPETSLNYAPYYKWGDSNDSIDSQYGPSSMHAGTINHLLSDGSVRGIDDTIEPRVYDALVTRSGGELEVLPE